jgi:hypothetical protein
MGVSRSPDQAARKLRTLTVAISDLPRAQVEDAALILKRNILALAPARLSGVGRKGARVGVRYNVGSYPDGAKALVFATGPFHLIERDTKAHRIPRERRRGRRRYAVVPGVGPRARVQHPGTKGKHPFARGVQMSEAAVQRAVRSSTDVVLRRIF